MQRLNGVEASRSGTSTTSPGQPQLVELEACHQRIGHHQIAPTRRQHFKDVIDVDGVMNGKAGQILLAQPLPR